jgi:hypothetical protein
MAANFNPIFTLTPDVSDNLTTGFGGVMTTAAADWTGISANYQLIHTAGTNGSYIRRLRFKALGPTNNVASVARIFINNGSVNTTATNNAFYGELSLPATTGTATAATVDLDYPMEFQLNPQFRIYVGLGTTVATGWVCTAIAAQY